MHLLDKSAAEATRIEARALIVEARAAVARLQHTREKLASPSGAKWRDADALLAEGRASLQKAHASLRRANAASNSAGPQVRRSAPTSPRPHRRPSAGERPPPPPVVRQDLSVGEALSAAAALLELGAPNEAWEALDHLDTDQQASAEALAMRARVFHALEMPGMADLVTFAIQAGSPGWGHRHFLAAQALARLGLADRARELARMACALQPDLKFDVLECADLAALLHAEAP